MQVLYGTGGISMIYLELLWSFMQVGLFSIGGGYAAIPLIQHQAIEVHSWLTMQEFADIMTISEMTPGPITINSATFVGIRVAGIPGAVVATLGCIIPSAIIVLLLAYVYYHWRGLDTVQSIFRSLRPCVIAMIASAEIPLISLALYGGEDFAGTLRIPSLIIFTAAFLALRLFRIGPIATMVISGTFGLIAGVCIL